MKIKIDDTDIYIIVVGATIILLILLSFIISFLFIYRHRQLRNKLEQKQIREKYEQEVLITQLEIKEQTLKNISEEIHDNIGQVLSLVILNLSAIDFKDLSAAAKKIDHITGMIQRIISNLRNLSKTMDADNISKIGMASMIAMELDQLKQTGTYKIFFQTTGVESKLDIPREIVIFRIVQESLNNIIKHAKATEISIGLKYSTKDLTIEIIDNGIGFKTDFINEGTIQKDGAGLRNMARRSTLIQANFKIESVLSRGTKIKLTIPFSNEN